MGRRALALAMVVVSGGLGLAACRADTVSLGFEPEVGAVYRYRYEIEATVTSALSGETPRTTEVTTTITSEQEVVEVTADGARVEVTLTVEGGAPRTAMVVLDRAGSLEAIQELDGLPEPDLGGPSAADLLASVAARPPDEPLSPGERWPIADGSTRGEARLERLGVVDDHDVAVVTATLLDTVEDVVTVAASEVQLDGTLRSTTTTTYDLADGSVRQATTRSEGTVAALVAPPAGVDAAPVSGTVTYELRVRTSRR